MLEKFFFLTVSWYRYRLFSEFEQDPELNSLFLLALLLFFHIAHFTRAWAAAESRKNCMYRTRKIDVVEQNSFPRDKALIASNAAKFHAHNLNRIDRQAIQQHLIHFN